MKDMLKPIESRDIEAKEKINLERKNLEQMTSMELASVIDEMLSLVEENDEMTEQEKEIIEKINVTGEKKALALGYVIKTVQEANELVDHEIEFYNKKIKEKEDRKRVLQNRIKSRSYHLDILMHKIGKKKIESGAVTVSLQKQRQKVIFLNDDIDHTKYPKDIYEVIPESIKFKKNKIAEYLKANESDDFSMSNEPMKLIVK